MKLHGTHAQVFDAKIKMMQQCSVSLQAFGPLIINTVYPFYASILKPCNKSLLLQGANTIRYSQAISSSHLIQEALLNFATSTLSDLGSTRIS